MSKLPKVRMNRFTSSSNVKVTSYNILSTHLSDPDYFQSCNPRWLDPHYRLRKLQHKLLVETSQRSIICLQEVSTSCASKLHPYFARMGYQFIVAHYGTKFDGYMGVGIAIPLDKYEIIDVNITRIGNTKKTMEQRYSLSSSSESSLHKVYRQYIWKPIIHYLKQMNLIQVPIKSEAFDIATKRFNQMITVKLNIKATATTICTTTTNNNNNSNNIDLSSKSSGNNSNSRSGSNSSIKYDERKTETIFQSSTYDRIELSKDDENKTMKIQEINEYETKLFHQTINLYEKYLYGINEIEDNNTIENTDNTFVVGTYHMPCMYDNPAVMMIHCALSAQHIQKYAQGSPYIFTGDFNIKPVDSMYKLLTEGDIDANDPARPVNDYGDNWSLKVQPMNSAYKLYYQKEPEFTNYAQVRLDPPFIDTLDYIFLSPHWKVNHVLELPSLESMTSSGGGGGPLPTEHEPSDHLMIAADLSLQS